MNIQLIYDDVFFSIQLMISWQSQLTPVQMQNVASYILTMQGTTPANPKEPQGELYVPPADDQGAGEDVEEAQAISMN